MVMFSAGVGRAACHHDRASTACEAEHHTCIHACLPQYFRLAAVLRLGGWVETKRDGKAASGGPARDHFWMI